MGVSVAAIGWLALLEVAYYHGEMDAICVCRVLFPCRASLIMFDSGFRARTSSYAYTYSISSTPDVVLLIAMRTCAFLFASILG